MLIRETYSNTISFPVTNEYDKDAVMQISTVFGHSYHVACRIVLRNFLGIYVTTFSESVISEKQKLWGSSFCSKRSKFQIDFKNAAKNTEKVSRFPGSCI